MAMHLWKNQLFRKKLIFHCDNLGATQAWSSLKSTCPAVIDLQKKRVMIAAVSNFCSTIKHISGLDNSIADALSRFQVQRFRELAPYAEPLLEAVPEIFPVLETALNQVT